MDQKAKDDLKQALIYQPGLLSFESQREYRQLEDAIRDHISPRDILEQMWTSEIVETEWETVRLRRYKGQIVNLAKQLALRNLLHLICADADEDQINDLARRWFTNKDVRKRVEALLRSHDFDESVINVEAYRLSMADLAEIDRRLCYLAVRRDKLFGQIEDYRAGIKACAFAFGSGKADRTCWRRLMASERQIVANRQNGRRSRGPKSSAGKRHSSANAVRHGLSRKIGARGDPETEALADVLAGDTADEESLEHARNVVRAHRDLLRIREVKRDLIERLYWFGAPLRRFRSRSAEIRYLMSLPVDRPLQWPQRLDPAATLPLDRDERAAETVRRLLPDLRNLNRYERRAFKAKQDALRKLAGVLKF